MSDRRRVVDTPRAMDWAVSKAKEAIETVMARLTPEERAEVIAKIRAMSPEERRRIAQLAMSDRDLARRVDLPDEAFAIAAAQIGDEHA